MKSSPNKPPANRSRLILTGVIGGLLSVTLHELVHVISHWGQITGVNFFPNFYTVAELIIDLPTGYDLDGEEFLAYVISAVTLIVTAIIIAKIYDSTDSRSVNQILFPRPTQIARPAKTSPKKPATTSTKTSTKNTRP